MACLEKIILRDRDATVAIVCVSPVFGVSKPF